MPTSQRPAAKGNSATREYHHGALREALLEAGMALIAERGVEGLSLREAARRIGVSHNAPYKHFPTREALLAALAEQGFVALAAAIAAAEARGRASPAIARGLAYVEFALAHPALFRMMFSGAVDRSEFPGVQQAASRGLAELGRFVGATYGEDRLDDATVSAWAFVHGLAQLLLDDQLPGVSRSPAARRAYARRVLTAMNHALGGDDA